MADAQYNEILAVRVKTDDFATGINKLIEEWNRFKTSVGNDNIGAAIGAGMFGEISKSLSAIQETLNALASSVNVGMEAMASGAVKSVSTIKTAVEEAQE